MSAAGRKRCAYVNTGTYTTPVWTELKRISDVNRPQSRGTSDRMYRGAKNKKKITGYKEFSFTFKYHVKKFTLTDTVLDKLQDSFDTDTTLDVAFLNRSIVLAADNPAGSAVGVRAPVVVTKFDLSEADEDGVTYDVELSEVEDEQSSVLVETVAFSVTLA